MARLYSYIVRVDSGFAPNPFYGSCTVATCKPRIRSTAQVGDWIIGTGSKSKSRDGYLVFAKRVGESMSFQEYWEDPRFRRKRPKMGSSKEKACGDNIYYKDPGTKRYCQVPSYHSCPDGTQDNDKLRHDTRVDRVLISDDYIYWGGDGPPFPSSVASTSVVLFKDTNATSLMKLFESSSDGFAASRTEASVAGRLISKSLISGLALLTA